VRVHEHGSWEFDEGDEIVPGRYAVRLLGGGRRYEAYVAWDDALHALAVVKILRPELCASAAARGALEDEARMLRSLAHPSLVRMFDARLGGKRPHVLLEYLDGPRLSTLLRRYGVVVEQLLPLALELCAALHYLHAREVVHLDVKPRNIVMSARPRLIDLSVAMSLDGIARISSPVGTDAYMSPEQCDPARFPQVGPASDMWGLGVTLYEALAAARPFPPPEPDHDDLEIRYPQVALEPAPLPPDVPLELAALVLACLEPSPADRPTASELAAVLEPWTARLPGPRLGLFRPGGRARAQAYEAGDESILRSVSRRSHRARVLLSSMSQREGGTR
jgi:serine/threonine-protein kinase